MRVLSIFSAMAILVGPSLQAAPSGQTRVCRVTAPCDSSADPWAQLEKELLDQGLDPNEIVLPGEITDEMEMWAREQVTADTPREIVEELLAALIDSEGLQLEYTSEYTGTAIEVFETRKANCLAFTHLFVGLSRALGVPTLYVYWNRVEQFRKDDDLVVISGHISAGLGSLIDLFVLKFGAVEGLEARGVAPISDLNALARHYANRAAELLSDGDLDAAVRSGELATRIDPALGEAWVNLGVARRRAGYWVGAETAYRQATEVDPGNLSAYQNLRVLLRLRGESDAAEQILSLLDQRGNRNPFVYLELGDESLVTDLVEEAGRYYRRAYKLGPDLAETRAARGNWFLEAGAVTKARKWLRRAQSVDATERRTRELETRLSERKGETIDSPVDAPVSTHYRRDEVPAPLS